MCITKLKSSIFVLLLKVRFNTKFNLFYINSILFSNSISLSKVKA